MPRLSDAVKRQYALINADSLTCYYCENPAGMEDLTPHPKASAQDQSVFMEAWTRTRVCRACWGKIYSANIVAAGVKYGTRPGCMTLANKQHLLRKAVLMNSETKSSIGKVFNDWIGPTNLFRLENGSFVYNGITIFEDELQALQPAFYCKVFAPDKYKRQLSLEALHGAYALDKLDQAKDALYLELLDLEDDYENDQTTSEDSGSTPRWEPELEASSDGPSDMGESSGTMDSGW